MRLEQLEILIEVANTHSMQKACENLHTSIQNISKSIKQLERELDVALVRRSKEGVFLTADGKFVYEHALEIAAHSAAIRQHYLYHIAPAEKLSGNLRIISSAAMSIPVSQKIDLFAHKYPDLHISHLIDEPLHINQLIEANTKSILRFDLILTSINHHVLNSWKNFSDKYIIYFLSKDYIGARLRADNEFAKSKSIALRNLLSLPSTSYSVNIDIDNNQLLSVIKDETGIEIIPTLLTNSTDKCDNFILKNDGYGLIAFSEMKRNSINETDFCNVPLQEKIALDNLLLIPRNKEKNEAVYRFKQQILAQFKDTYTRIF